MVGVLAGLVLDRLWWESGLNKYEKGVEELEHYHWGLVAWIAAHFTPPAASSILLGLGLALVIAEWAQIGEWKDGVWRRGHPFSYGSKHFACSITIGAVLFAVLVVMPLFSGVFLPVSPEAFCKCDK